MKNKRVKQMIADTETYAANSYSTDVAWYHHWGHRKGQYCLLNNYHGSIGRSVRSSWGTVSIKGKV